jgi:hypothetical protein
LVGLIALFYDVNNFYCDGNYDDYEYDKVKDDFLTNPKTFQGASAFDGSVLRGFADCSRFYRPRLFFRLDE